MGKDEFESLERKAHNNLIRLQREYERMEYGYDRKQQEKIEKLLKDFFKQMRNNK